MTDIPNFESPFLHARAVRHGRHPSPQRPERGLEAASMIPWREFVQAIYELPSGWDLHGDIPEGVSPQQFWSKVQRAAKQATRAERLKSMSELKHAKIGIVTRGQRFWVWPEKVPAKVAKEDRPPTNARRGWMGELLLRLRTGEPVVIEKVLTNKEKGQLRQRAGRRGWKIHISHRPTQLQTRVQWIGES